MGISCDRTHTDGLLFHITEAEQFVELFVCAIIHNFFPGPGQSVDKVHHYRRSFTEAFGINGYNVFVWHTLWSVSIVVTCTVIVAYVVDGEVFD